ncbi:MAG: hypothetical protein OXU23_01775 [Candidatus Poribacteria bacterium]|nr:hypothetical protein [Candidatus Poribacteria bacterium]
MNTEHNNGKPQETELPRSIEGGDDDHNRRRRFTHIVAPSA